jgi:hypothetical protein
LTYCVLYLQTFSIVAVHDLCDDQEISWSDGVDNFWLQDLPFYLAHARVSTYYYRLDSEGVSATEIDEKAKELLDTFYNGDLAETVSLRLVLLR